MPDQPEGAAEVAGPRTADEAVTELMEGTSNRLAECVTEWIGSFDAALKGGYNAERLTKDATRMTSELIRDAAKLFVSGYEFLELVADMPKTTAPAPPAAGNAVPTEGAGR